MRGTVPEGAVLVGSTGEVVGEDGGGPEGREARAKPRRLQYLGDPRLGRTPRRVHEFVDMKRVASLLTSSE